MKLLILVCSMFISQLSLAMTCDGAGDASCDYKIVGSSCQDNSISKGVCVGTLIYSRESAQCICRRSVSPVPTVTTCSAQSGSCKHLSVGTACDLGGTKAGRCVSKGFLIDGKSDCSCKKVMETPSRPTMPTPRPYEVDPRIINPTPARPSQPGRGCQYPQVC
jgi:hypothetical protein